MKIKKLFVLLPISYFLLNCCFSAGWEKRYVDWKGDVGIASSIAIDASGNPQIAYYDSTNFALKYAKYDGTQWSMQIVDGYSVTASTTGPYNSIAVDNSGNPHIAYYDSTNGILKYAKHNGVSWLIQTVDSSGNTGMYCSIAVDSSGAPHISYYDASNGVLKYAKLAGGTWAKTTVDSSSDTGRYSSIALSSAGNPHVSYYDVTNGDLKFAEWNDSSWTVQAVDTADDTGVNSSLAIDSSGVPHIAYFNQTYGVKYASWTGTAWVSSLVDTSGDIGWQPSVAVDANGMPYIAYSGWINKELKYAKWNGSSWILGIADASGINCWNPSIKIDVSGTPHISYYDQSNGDLKHAVLKINPVNYCFVKGYVKKDIGRGMNGVMVSLSGAGNYSDETCENGFYQLMNIPEGIYTLTPQKAGFSFAPYNKQLVLSSNIENQNFDIFVTAPAGEVKIQGGRKGYVLPNEGEKAQIVINPSKTGEISIKIYNLAGSIVWEEKKTVIAGTQNVTQWDCRLGAEFVGAGIYGVRVKGVGIDFMGKIAVIK